MKIQIDIGDDIFSKLQKVLKRQGAKVTVEELQKNPKVLEWFVDDIENVYSEQFGDNLGDCVDAKDLGLEVDEDYEWDDEDYEDDEDDED